MQGSGTGAANFEGFAQQIFVGNRKDLGRPYVGSLDDLKLYNYALTPNEVAMEYVDAVGPVCVNRPVSDLSGDCRVGIADLAIMAGGWLDSGLYMPSARTLP